MDKHDESCATGCVLTDEDGKHHIFYTGINGHFYHQNKHSQVIMHAVSDDLVNWEKVPGQMWLPDEDVYEKHDWRDPCIFWHPEEKQYYMLVASRLKDGPKYRRGCTGLMVSKTLTDWVAVEPFYAPNRYEGHECPDFFKMGDWYYLTFSEYTDRTTTRYVMSKTPTGPWIAPDGNVFDNRAFYAAKSAGDGKRRFMFGWNPTKYHHRDDGGWRWGGCLTIHEIIQNPDGTLRVQLPVEIEKAFGTEHNRLPEFGASTDELRVEAPYEQKILLGEKTCDTYAVRVTFNVEKEQGSFGLLLKVDDNADSGYFVKFNIGRKTLQFGRIGGHRHWYLEQMPELERELDINFSQPINAKVLVDKTAVVVYVNDAVAMSARAYDNPRGRLGVFADGTTIRVPTLTFAELADGVKGKNEKSIKR
jgi:beta-fructofuranosidase